MIGNEGKSGKGYEIRVKKMKERKVVGNEKVRGKKG